jgi:RNA polymerase sigma-70 factor (ECF subfamily)
LQKNTLCICKKNTLLKKIEILTLSDADLLSQYRESDESIYVAELFNRYVPLLYGVCLKYLKETGKAQDTVIRFTEVMYNKISECNSDDFRSWIYQGIKNFCLQILCAESGREVRIKDDSDFIGYGDIMSLLEKESSYDDAKMLKHCLENLPEQDRICLIYFFMDGLSFADIVDKTGYTLEQVKTYIRQGKRNLKISIENK